MVNFSAHALVDAVSTLSASNVCNSEVTQPGDGRSSSYIIIGKFTYFTKVLI